MSRRPAAPSLLDYGAIGDLHSVALVGRDGSLDWLCLPRLDSPSVFAALLDDDRGGHFRIAPDAPFESSQAYRDSTNVLETRFRTATGTCTLTDFMPVEEIDRDEYGSQEVHRILEATGGLVRGRLEFEPRFDYARAQPRIDSRPHGVLATAPDGATLALSMAAPLRVEAGSATAEWALREGQRITFVLRYGTPFVRAVGEYDTERKLAAALEFWREWSARCNYAGRWRGPVLRSALALKLLTYAPTGALAAAATTSLPESPGGVRNWDYRFSWVRDSAFAMRSFLDLGYSREARRYLRWLRRLLRGLTDEIALLRVGYGMEGETRLDEFELPHLEGYLGSRPVRVGNAAFDQFQLDIYGSLADAVFEAYRRPEGYPDEAWRTVRAVADHVVKTWERPDHGIWEFRGEPRRFTHSALMAWVAVDRAILIAEARGHHEYLGVWGEERERMRRVIESEGWNERVGSFVQVLGGEDVDASLLLVPILGFLPGDDPRVQSTIRAVQDRLSEGPFVYRYRNDDGLPGREGSFLLCGFWMAHAMALAGRVEEGIDRFEALSRLAGPVGLFSEEVEVDGLRPLGNFPQALTHLSHIRAALALERALEDRVPAEPPSVPALR